MENQEENSKSFGSDFADEENKNIDSEEERIQDELIEQELMEEMEENFEDKLEGKVALLNMILKSLKKQLEEEFNKNSGEEKIIPLIEEIENLEKLVEQLKNADENKIQIKKRINDHLDKSKSFISLRYFSFNNKDGWCPYCLKSESTKYLSVTHQLHVKEYEKLLDRGFVLDGSNIILQDPYEVCCIYRHIRTNVNNFKIRKSQKKAWKRWEKFLRGERGLVLEREQEIKKEEFAKYLEEVGILFRDTDLQGNFREVLKQFVKVDKLDGIIKGLKFKEDKKGKNGVVISDFLIRLFWDDKNNSRTFLENEFQNINDFFKEITPKILEFLNSKEKISKNWQISFTKKGYLKLTSKNLSKSPENIEENITEEYGYNLYEKKERKFEIRISKAEFSKEKYELYALYNEKVHKKERPTEKSFERFLCTQSLIYEGLKSPEYEEENPSQTKNSEKNSSFLNNPKELHLGCYHLELRLDGKLFGVLVHQYLYSGTISVYFFYNPVFQKISIGIVTAILEINLIKERHKYFPNHKYYYLYTYVQGNSRLAYKMDFKPVEIYCQATRNWIYAEGQVWKRLEENQVRLADEIVKKNHEDNFEEDFLGYLAQTISGLNPLMPAEDISEEKPPRNFDLEKIEYMTLSVDPNNEAGFGWWVRKLVYFYPVISAMGQTAFLNSYWDVSNVRVGAEDS